MNIIKLKIGQNSISNSIVKSKYTQNIDTSQAKNLFGDSKLIDDYFLKGGYKVVSDIDCRNNISCEYRKLGMQVMVVGPDASFKKYVLKGQDPCSNDNWEEATIENIEVEVNNIVKNYIPLSGTLSQFPVIGNIEFSTDYDTKLFSGDAEIKLHDGYLELNSTNNNSVAINPNQVYVKSGSLDNFKYINLTDELDYIPVKSNVNGAGLVGTNYYGNNYVDNSYVQKKYVDDALYNIDLSNYYLKSETYSQTEINGFLFV